MSFEFSEELYIKTIDTSEKIQCGKFTTAVDTEIEHMRIMIYINNITVTTERMRINVMSKYGHANPLYSSDWSDLSGITNIAAYWVGWLRFDFNGKFFDSDIDYFLELETGNYTRTGDTNYLGAALDYPFEVSTSTNEMPAVGVEFYGFE